MNKTKFSIGIVAIIAGIAFIAIGFLPKHSDAQQSLDNWNRLSSGQGMRAEAQIVDAEIQAQPEASRQANTQTTVYCPVYEYTVNNAAQRVTAIDNCELDETMITLDQTGTVLYDPSNPQIAFVDTPETEAYFETLGGVPLWNIIFGSIIILAGVITIIAGRPKVQRKLEAISSADNNAIKQ